MNDRTELALPAYLITGPRQRSIHLPVSFTEHTGGGGRRQRFAISACYLVFSAPVWLDEAPGRPMCTTCQDSHIPVVYRCYSTARALLYIGCTAHWRARRRRHEMRSSWWPDVADIAFETFLDERTAWEAEYQAIRAESPLHNRDRDGQDPRGRCGRGLARSFGAELTEVSAPGRVA